MTGRKGGNGHTVVTISLDHVTEIGLRAVRRSYAFLGIGVEAGTANGAAPSQLPGAPETDVLRGASLGSVLPNARQDFARWVTGQALEDGIEGFGVFLEAIFEALELSLRQRWPDAQQLQPFHARTIDGKLALLSDRYGIASSFTSQLASLTVMADCLRRRHGIVSRADCQAGDHLQVCWSAPRAAAGQSSGRVDPKDMELRLHSFPLGDTVTLDPPDLREICFMIKTAIEEISARTLECLRQSGVSIREVRKA